VHCMIVNQTGCLKFGCGVGVVSSVGGILAFHLNGASSFPDAG
jgi:hypothetical protein